MLNYLKQRIRHLKPTRPKLLYDGATSGYALPKMTVSDSVQALEPRIMFDAAGVVTGAEVAADTVAEEQAEQALTSESLEAQAVNQENKESDEVIEALADLVPPAGRNEIVFVDKSVEDYTSLIAGISSDAELVFIDSSSDGLEQIANVLNGRNDIDAIHIVSHGDAGQLQLGNTVLTQESMQGEHADELATIKTALGESADILIYGCNFAEGETGLAAANALAELTGADIAASEDLTGHASLGGDWDLEQHVGEIETEVFISEQATEVYVGTLLTVVDANTVTATDITTEMSPAGNGLTITNEAIPNAGDDAAVGQFTNGGTLGIDSGAVFSTGEVEALVSASNIALNIDNQNFNSDDDQLDLVVNGDQVDRSEFTHNFQTDTGITKIAIQYVFATDQDPALIPTSGKGANKDYNDAFAISITDDINGSGDPLGKPNPAVWTEVAGDSILSLDSAGEFTRGYLGADGSGHGTGFDYITDVKTGVATVTDATLYHMKFELADYENSEVDTAVFVSYFGSSLSLDADANDDSGAAGFDYQDAFNYDPASTGISIVDSDATLTNFDTTNITSATVTISTGFDNTSANTPPVTGTGDQLIFSDTGTISGSYDAVTGVLTLTGADTAANYEAALKSILFNTQSDTTGARAISIVVNDGVTNSNTATSTITVNSVNQAPVANVDTAITNEDTVLNSSVDVDVNDTDVAGSTLTVTAGTFATTQGGSITIAADGSYSYTPPANFNGDDTYTYTVSDEGGLSDTATLTITVNPVNDPPEATDDIGVTTEDTPLNNINVIANDTDIEGDTLSVTAASATNGTVSINGDNSLNYTPNSNFSGVETITYTIEDANGGTDTASVTITVNAVNDPTVASDDVMNTVKNTSVSFDVTANDTDVDLDTLTVTQIDGTAITAGGAAVTVANGSVSLAADGKTLTFIPTSNYVGAISFSYTVSDGALSDTANVTGTVGDSNAAPIAVDDSFTVDEDTTTGTLDLISNDTDADGDTLSVQSIAGTTLTPGTAQTITVTNGTVNVNAAGVITFTPDTNYNGSISFDYVVTDGTVTDIGTVTGTVNAVNDPTVVVSGQSYTGDEGDTVTNTLVATDADGLTDGTVFTNTAPGVAGASATINPDTGVWSYTPVNTDWFGTDSFTVTITDDQGGTQTQVISVTLTNVNDPTIVVSGQSYTGNEGDTVTNTLVATDADGLTDGTVFTNTSPGVAGASATIDPDTGVWSYTPVNADWFGTDSFTVTITDDQGGTQTQVISVTLANVNDAPVATDDVMNTVKNTSVSLDVTINDTDVDLDTLTVTQIDGTAITAGGAAVAVTNGSVSLAADGKTITFDPDNGYKGPISFSYTVSDGTLSDTANITGSVGNTNAAPIAVDDSFTVDEDTTTGTLDLISNDTDADGDTLSVQSIAGTTLTPGTAQTITVTNGIVNVNAAGVITFTPDANYNGSINFDYVVTDGTVTDIGTATGTVNAVNDEPTALALGSVAQTLPENTNTASDVVLTAITITDDALGTNTITLSGADAADFDVDGSGNLVLKAGTALDFESGKTTYNVTVNVDDTSIPGGALSQNYVLTVGDVNEEPTALALGSVAQTLPENTDTASDVVLTAITITDDALGTNTITLTGADAADFDVDGSGNLVLKAGTALDFESGKTTYNVTVNVDDEGIPGSAGISENFTLTISDVDEVNPIVPATTTIGYDENNGAGSVGSVTISDNVAVTTAAFVGGTGKCHDQ